MLTRIAAFELRYQLRSPVFVITFAVFFLGVFASVAGGIINLGVPGNVHVNSPFAIVQRALVINQFALFAVTAFVAGAVIRDAETGFAPILYAMPLRKRDYVLGRFLGAMGVALLLLTAVPLATLLGSAMPWLAAARVGPFVPAHYLYAFFWGAVPVMLVCGATLFALATATRSMMWTYVGLVAFFMLYAAVATLQHDRAYDAITALADPFGLGAFFLASKYWTVAERNSLLPPLTGVLLANRLFWLGIAGLLFAGAYARFRFEERGASPQKASGADAAAPPPPLPGRQPAPVAGRAGLAAFWALTRLEMRIIFTSPAFYVLLLLGALLVYLDLPPNIDRDGAFLPVTRAVIPVLQNSFTVIPWIIALYYGGELVWRERERRLHEIVDACPVPGWVLLLPKILAVGLALCATLMAAVLMGMEFQLGRGWWQLEPLHYGLWFLLPEAIFAWQLAALAVCIQSLVPHKVAGWGILVLLIAISLALPGFGFEHGLYRYGYTSPVPLSDMNGMGRFWVGRAWFQLYWSAFAAILVVLSILLLRRGAESRLAPRLVLAWRGLRGPAGAVLALAALVWLGAGAFIYYNTNILNDYSLGTQLDADRHLADKEKALLAYESVPQPKIVAVTLDVQLYPREARAETVGSYVLENRTGAPIPVLHVHWFAPLQMRELDVGVATLEKEYKTFNYRIYRLDQPLAPGERRTLRFRTQLGQRGFPNGQPMTGIVENGTFLNNVDVSPLLGITRRELLSDRSRRLRHGLPAELRPPKLEEHRGDGDNYILRDSDWLDAQISVTTDADQTPLAPGYPVSDTVAGGRRTLVTRSEVPLQNRFSIQSARYAIARDIWQGRDGRKVELAVYHHPPHDQNVARMLTAMKASLDVYSERFGPYPYRHLRILEFPAYGMFAGQSFSGTVAYSEGAGFVQSFDDRDADTRIDVVTYITAHEVGHQWWAEQVTGADKQGATMLTETLAQYSALLVMEKLYGREQIRKFLKDALDKYLRGRGTEAGEELPLARVEDQTYIHYDKGAVVMYGLKESVGEAAVDRALRRLLAAYAFRHDPYPSTTDFLALLRQEAGAAHDPEIRDLFERITLYDMKAHDATAHRLADGRFEVRFVVEGRKLYADGQGRETEAPLDELFDVGAFTVEPGTRGYRRDSVVKLVRVPVRSGRQVLTLVVDRLPAVVGIDPFNERIDRISDDNLTPVKLE